MEFIGGLGKVAPIKKVRLAYQGAAMTPRNTVSMNRLDPIGIGASNGTLTIYSAPKAVIRHVEWTISNILGCPVEMTWRSQPLAPSTQWTTINWRGPLGTASKIASELSGWHYLRFEIYESCAQGLDGSLFMFVPEMGIFRASIGPHGDVMVSEHQLTGLIRDLKSESDIVAKIEKVLGKPWDEDLECYRRAIADGEERYLARLSV